MMLNRRFFSQPTCGLLLALGLMMASVTTATAQKHLTKRGIDPFAKTSPNARKLPPPKPVQNLPTAYEADKEKLRQLDSAMYPHIEEAQKTLKDVHRRWIKGLPRTDQVFVMTRAYAPDGSFEHVLVRVDNWMPNRIAGTVASVLATTNRYQPGQQMQFEQTIVVDWKIKHQDGSEEGNYVASFLNDYYAEQTGKKRNEE